MSGSGEQLLHGDLELTIHRARGLPNMDVLSTLLRRLCFCPAASPPSPKRSVPPPAVDDDDRIHSHHHHHHLRRRHKPQPRGHHILPTSDPYAAVVVPGPPDVTLARTHVVRNAEAPEWSARVVVPLAHFASHVLFQVKDADPFGSDLIGVASLSAHEILAAADRPVDSRWLDLFRPDGRGTPKPNSAICVSATFVPAATRRWRDGVPAYFPPRRGCEVKLYQDAHVAAGELEGEPPGPGRCWEDLCLAVLSAQQLVYVVGWSVYTEVRLLREAMSPEMAEKAAEVRAMSSGVAVEDMNLGQLLKYKSQEGVRVCLLVWDDKTSHDTPFFRTTGVMQTHDEETNNFFKHSSVICQLAPRYPSSKLSMFKQKANGFFFFLFCLPHHSCPFIHSSSVS
jgi:phospholipase D1/2